MKGAERFVKSNEIRRWVDEGTASRDEGCRNRIGEIVAVGDSIVAKV
jgi:hypothetical protein